MNGQTSRKIRTGAGEGLPGIVTGDQGNNQVDETLPEKEERNRDKGLI